MTYVYFRFSHYTSMEKVSCHSKESTPAMAMQNTISVEANIMNIFVKCHLIVLMAS